MLKEGRQHLEDAMNTRTRIDEVRRDIKKELKKAKLLRKRNELRKADPAKMAALRKKFIEQAKKYFGYPYARKYWPPDSPEYKSKLFLDCCGLVRQVMRDLTYDFGFVIGPWNQAYMYDTLPKTVAKEEDMQPGDLVFVSATYVNPKSKKQRHNMTHVEIWLGDGPKTIGARWNNGKVQVWDSYKFNAKSYYNETYHFKSLDTWLKGICESFCSEHRWKRRKYVPSKKSIFHVESDQSLTDQQDQRAGDDGNDTEGKTKSASDNKGTVKNNKDKGDDGDEEETDDEMCNASPDTDEGDDDADLDEDAEKSEDEMNDAANDMDENDEVVNGNRSKIQDLSISEQFSVDLNNRGLYLHDLVEKCSNGQNNCNDDSEDINDDLKVRGTRDESNGHELDKNLLVNADADNNTDNIDNIGGSVNLGEPDNTTYVQSKEALPDKLAVENIIGELQNLPLFQTSENCSKNAENTNQNALPKDRKVKDGTADGKQIKVSVVSSASSLDNDGAGSQHGADSIASDISIASSQTSDKGAE